MPTRVVLLEDDDDLRDTMADILGLSTGAECVCVGSVAELKTRRVEVLRAQLVLLDINLGPDEPSGVDAYEWLKESGYAGRVVFLTGHGGAHPLVKEARRVGGAAVLTKPVPYTQLTELVREASA
ncbi:MAG: response regulator [Polyangiales bacterium]